MPDRHSMRERARRELDYAAAGAIALCAAAFIATLITFLILGPVVLVIGLFAGAVAGDGWLSDQGWIWDALPWVWGAIGVVALGHATDRT